MALGLATATPVAKPGVLSKGNRKRLPRSVVIGTAASVSGWPAIWKANTAVPPIEPVPVSSAEPTASVPKNPSVWMVRDPPTGMAPVICDWNPSGPNGSLHVFPLSSQNLSVKLTGTESMLSRMTEVFQPAPSAM